MSEPTKGYCKPCGRVHEVCAKVADLKKRLAEYQKFGQEWMDTREKALKLSTQLAIKERDAALAENARMKPVVEAARKAMGEIDWMAGRSEREAHDARSEARVAYEEGRKP